MIKLVEVLILITLSACIGLIFYAVSLIPEHQEWAKQCEAKGGTVIKLRAESKCLDVKEIKV